MDYLLFNTLRHTLSSVCVVLVVLSMPQPQQSCGKQDTIQEKQARPTRMSECIGKVATITKTAITLQTDDKAKRHYAFAGLLIGDPQIGPFGPTSYRPDQIRVEDRVELLLYHDGVKTSCIEVKIHRRPGGRVPEQPETPKDAGFGAWHRRMNAYQDWEERGIHLPPEYETPYPRGLTPPYFKKQPVPIAPPPRVVWRNMTETR